MTVPFGSGSTVFYNYLDFMFENTTKETFQVLVRVGEEYLEGEIRSGTEPDTLITVEERGHRFVRRDGVVYRENELWKVERPVNCDAAPREELLLVNCAEVRYNAEEIPGIEIEEDS